jgi:hypothetical protein
MIIAIKDKDCVHIAFDKNEWMLIGITKHDLMLESNLPYWKPEGINNTVMTITSNFRARDTLRYNLNFEKPLSLKYLQFEFASQMRKILIDSKITEDKEDEYFENVIIASDNLLYTIDKYYFVEEIQEFIVFDHHEKIAMEVFDGQNKMEMSILERINEVIAYCNVYANNEVKTVYIVNTRDMVLVEHKIS